MDLHAPRVGGPDQAPVGYHHFTDDVSINFQCNRWLQWIALTDDAACAEVASLARHAGAYPEWIDGFLALAEDARSTERTFAAAYYDRAANFFMLPDDPRRPETRARFVGEMRQKYGVTPEFVTYGPGALPAYDLIPASQSRRTLVMHGGFDSFIEELFPMMAALVDAGHRVVAFDGPGQGGALDDAGLTMTPQWEHPMKAILDHFSLDDVTAVGISLGGYLVIRAAAFESRITSVVAYDVLDNYFEAATRQIGRGAPPLARLLLRLRARRLVNAIARTAATRSPVSSWGLQQGLRITGSASAFDFLSATAAYNTKQPSRQITADVLLLAGTDDHYVPLHQLRRQAATLTAARSVTTRTFTAADQASNHCQVGNIGLVVRVIDSWLDQIQTPPRP